MKREVITAGVCKAISLGSLVATTGVLARTITSADLGVYMIYLGTIQLAAVVAQLGLHQVIMRRLAERLERHEKTQAFIVDGLIKVLIVSLIIVVIASLVIWQAGFVMHDKSSHVYLAFGAGWAMLAALQLAIADSLKAFRLSALSFIYGETGSAVMTLVLVMLLAVSDREVTLSSIFAISICAAAVFTMLGARHLFAYAKNQDRHASNTAVEFVDYTGGWRICLAYSLMLGIYPAILWFAGYYGDAEIAGQFALSHKLASLIVLPMLVTNSMMPRRIIGYKLGRSGQREIQQISFLATAIAMIGIVTIATMGEFIVRYWLGANREDIVTMALWMQAGKLITVALGASNIILVVYNQERRFVEAGFVAIAILALILYLPYDMSIEYRIVSASICCAIAHATYQYFYSHKTIGFFYPFLWPQKELKTAQPKTAIIIAGIPKAGTTTLHDALLNHPDLLMPKIKEPSFFNEDENYKWGLRYYFEKYYPALENGSVIVDCSPLYAKSVSAARRIKQMFRGHVKVVLVLRDPVERAYSHYLHNRRDELYSKDVSFEAAFDLKNGQGADSDCVAYGKYHEIVSIWVNEFGKDNVLLLMFESDLASDLQTGVDKLCDFSGIQRIKVNNIKSNAARQSKKGFSVIRKAFFSDSKAKKLLKLVVPPIYRHQFRLFFNDLTSTEIKDKKTLDPGSKQRIYNKYFQLEMEALKRDYGIDYTLNKQAM